MVTDWDDAYANGAHIPRAADYPERWAAQAAAFREAHPPEVLSYGAHPRERIDLFEPDGAARGLAVFVHGGYWRAFDRDSWSHLAAGALACGWAVAMPGYVLAPEARVAEISAAIGRAIAVGAARVAGPVRLSGHSAGGHLVTRQICAGSGLPGEVSGRIERVVSISGLHDLRPFLRTALNDVLRLDAAEAAAESPALLVPLEGVRIHALVGADERPEFIRQSALLDNIWTGLGAEMSLAVEPGLHHFNVIDGMCDPSSALVEALAGG